jgi:hypothetical protein
MSIGGGGSSYEAPQPTAAEIAQADIAAAKWDDFVNRFVPVEDKLIDRAKLLDSESAYEKAMAQAINNAAQQTGYATNSAAQQMAGGGNASAMLSALSGGTEMAIDSGARQALGQRSNYLSQMSKLNSLGSDVSAQGMNTFNTVADYARSDDNARYATRVGKNLAAMNGQTASLGSLGRLGVMYGADNGWFNSGTSSSSSPWTSLDRGVSNGYTSPSMVKYADLQNFGSFAR